MMAPVRVRIGVLTVIVFALLSSGLALRHALDPPPWAIGESAISRYEARFRLVRSALPPEGMVGYVSEFPISPYDMNFAHGFYLTEYVLAPMVVVPSTAPALVIGNFRSGGAERSAAYPTLVLVRDFGEGVLLFRHQPR